MPFIKGIGMYETLYPVFLGKRETETDKLKHYPQVAQAKYKSLYWKFKNWFMLSVGISSYGKHERNVRVARGVKPRATLAS